MNKEELKNKILAIVPNAEVVEGKQYLEVTVAPEKLRELSKQLKESEDTYFDYLFCQTGVDYKDSLGVVYHLASTKYDHAVVLKSKTSDRDNAVLPTVSDIWHTAEYHEREIYDLVGITFTNHPDMCWFFLDESWSGHPFRKDYVDEENIITR